MYLSSVSRALVPVALGDHDLAFEALDEGVDRGALRAPEWLTAVGAAQRTLLDRHSAGCAEDGLGWCS